jgi:hypothetical protein
MDGAVGGLQMQRLREYAVLRGGGGVGGAAVADGSPETAEIQRGVGGDGLQRTAGHAVQGQPGVGGGEPRPVQRRQSGGGQHGVPGGKTQFAVEVGGDVHQNHPGARKQTPQTQRETEVKGHPMGKGEHAVFLGTVDVVQLCGREVHLHGATGGGTRLHPDVLGVDDHGVHHIAGSIGIFSAALGRPGRGNGTAALRQNLGGNAVNAAEASNQRFLVLAALHAVADHLPVIVQNLRPLAVAKGFQRIGKLLQKFSLSHLDASSTY